MYHVMLDRFSDGNPSNNGNSTTFNPLDSWLHHGGDFKGLEDKLPYIKSLGFRAIWVCPIMQTSYFLGANSYHNYGTLDWTLLERRFGTLAEFRTLVDAAHAMGMYLIVDITTHTGPIFQWDPKEVVEDVVPHHDTWQQFERHDSERPLARRPVEANITNQEVTMLQNLDFTINNTYNSTCRYPEVIAAGDRIVAEQITGGYCQDDFHHNGIFDAFVVRNKAESFTQAGAGDFDPWHMVMGGLPDLNQLRTSFPPTQRKLLAAFKALIASTDIDGIHIDAAHQMPPSFWRNVAVPLRAFATSLNKPNFLVVAELGWALCANCVTMSSVVGRGRLGTEAQPLVDNETMVVDAVQNFPLYFELCPSNNTAQRAPAHILQITERLRQLFDNWHPHGSQFSPLNMYSFHDESFSPGPLRNFLFGAVSVLPLFSKSILS